MIRGLYTSGWSMLADTKKMDVISNNLANINTSGFKRDAVVLESFDSVLTKRINDQNNSPKPWNDIGNMILGADVGQVYTDYRQGSILNSGRSLDLAIQNSGNAFFTVGPDDGQGLAEYYTRDGAFNIDSMGRLVTSNGLPVLGTDGGPIVVSSENFTVDADGTVTAGGSAAGRLMIRQFTDASGLRKRGDNLLEATAASEQTEFTGNVTQGALEQSNVNVIREMVDMITVTRSYEANQKIISALDSTLDKAVNEVGAVR